MDFAADIRRYTADIDDIALNAIVKLLRFALESQDTCLVSCGNDQEIVRIREGFAKKLLGLDAATSHSAIEHVCTLMQADKSKHRVTFYYLLAQHMKALGKLH